MHNLIKFRRTGTPDQFAERIGVSRSLLFRLLGELKDMGAPIHYCHLRKSYTYYGSVELQLCYISVPDMATIQTVSIGSGARVIPLGSPRPLNYKTAGL
ncbi:hypothetical protein CGL56_03500 [Neolewinella marina]|uniref:Uncharacterized protein n=2 Tax=Neolewinella marina TaxID=438751 RepID=A0A2G0CJG7_9BACT|nr:hypothetical protein CGL56_03500 [Neolewinella marina]